MEWRELLSAFRVQGKFLRNIYGGGEVSSLMPVSTVITMKKYKSGFYMFPDFSQVRRKGFFHRIKIIGVMYFGNTFSI